MPTLPILCVCEKLDTSPSYWRDLSLRQIKNHENYLCFNKQFNLVKNNKSINWIFMFTVQADGINP